MKDEFFPESEPIPVKFEPQLELSGYINRINSVERQIL